MFDGLFIVFVVATALDVVALGLTAAFLDSRW
jgi:hypothetical protein